MTQQIEKTQESTSSQNQIRNVRIQKMNNLRERGLNPYPYGYDKDIMAQIIITFSRYGRATW